MNEQKIEPIDKNQRLYNY